LPPAVNFLAILLGKFRLQELSLSRFLDLYRGFYIVAFPPRPAKERDNPRAKRLALVVSDKRPLGKLWLRLLELRAGAGAVNE